MTANLVTARRGHIAAVGWLMCDARVLTATEDDELLVSSRHWW
jgi:hypothetical protein